MLPSSRSKEQHDISFALAAGTPGKNVAVLFSFDFDGRNCTGIDPLVDKQRFEVHGMGCSNRSNFEQPEHCHGLERSSIVFRDLEL